MNKLRRTILTSALLTGLILAGAAVGINSWLGSAAALYEESMLTELRATEQQQANLFQTDATLLGTVDLKSGASGTYTGTWTTDELNVLPDDVAATIDLAFLLKKGADSGVDGYIDLQNSLVFTTQHTISTTRVSGVGSSITETISIAVGPKVNGSLMGNQLTLLSERIAYQTESGQAVQRQFQLTADAANQGELFRGDYRETVWGLTLNPLTVIGTFELQALKPTPVDTNQAPVANPQTVNVLLDTAKAITLSGTDAENGALTYTLTTDPVNGTLSGTAPNVTYTPKAGFTGSDSFTFSINDGNLDSDSVAVNINVTDGVVPTVAPMANAQSANATKGTAKVITLTGSDADKDPLTFSIVTQTTNGTIALDGAAVTYTPNADFVGTDSFTFKVNDGTVDSPAVKVTINVAALAATPTPVTPAPGATATPVTPKPDATATPVTPEPGAATATPVTPAPGATATPVTPAPDPANPDDDNDGIPNKDEDVNKDGDLTNDDTDGDGTPNYQDDDDDGDGTLTKAEGTGDANANGTPDYLEKEIVGTNLDGKIFLPVSVQ